MQKKKKITPLATENDLVRFLVESLLTPPEDSGLISPLPVGTKLLDYSLDDGICTLNFSGEFEQNLWARCESQRLALLSVVNTLTQLDDIHQGIHKVQCAFNEVPEREWFSAVNPIDFQVQGRFCTLVARAPREEVLDAVNAHQPVFLESMPLTLEEIFIAEMGGVGYEIQNILL